MIIFFKAFAFFFFSTFTVSLTMQTKKQSVKYHFLESLALSFIVALIMTLININDFTK